MIRLTEKQTEQLVGLVTRGIVATYPGSVSVLRALAKKGLVFEIENPYATNDWDATDAGVRVVEEIEEGDDYLASLKVAYGRALYDWQRNGGDEARIMAAAISSEIRSLEVAR